MSKDIMTTGKKIQAAVQGSQLQSAMPVAIHLIVWLLSLVSVCLVYEYDSHMELLHDCPDNDTVSITANFSYPLRVSSIGPLLMQCQESMTQVILEGDFHQECNLFLVVALCTMVVSAAIVTKKYLQHLNLTHIISSKLNTCQQSSLICTLMGVLLRVSMSALWLASSIILSNGTKEFQALVSLESVLTDNAEFCSEYNCRLEVEPSCARLWGAVSVGMVCSFIWLLLALVSFLRAWKQIQLKTKSNDPKATPHIESGHVTKEQGQTDGQEECQRFVNIPLSPRTPCGPVSSFRDPTMLATPRNPLDLNISIDFQNMNKHVAHV